MTDKTDQMSERIARQTRIDETCIDPIWSPNIDVPLLELMFASETPKQPVILLPELRFKSLLVKLMECIPGPGKLMIVDETNSRFENFRQNAPKSSLNLYYSTQSVSALNYANDIFHFVITEVGLSTMCRAEVVFSAYRRVLKPGGYFICAAPLNGTFSAYFDILEECLVRLCPQKCTEILDNLHQAMDPDFFANAIESSGLEVVGRDSVSFELIFNAVEQLLFSTLVESHYLGHCLNLNEPDIDSRALLTQLVRSFHHYFQGQTLKIPMQMGLFTAKKTVQA